MIYIAKLYYYGVTIEVPCSSAIQAKRVVMQARKTDITTFIKGQIITPQGELTFKIGA